MFNIRRKEILSPKDKEQLMTAIENIYSRIYYIRKIKTWYGCYVIEIVFSRGYCYLEIEPRKQNISFKRMRKNKKYTLEKLGLQQCLN